MASPLDHLDKLKIFVAVAEEGKINQSSAVLGLTQPSISRAIRTLEDAFGTALFVRGRSGVRLTEAGKLLHRSASRMLREVTDLGIRMRESHDELAGSLVVGSYESLAEYLWPDFLIHLQKVHPHLHLSVKTSGGRDVFSRLLEGQVDLLVDAEPRTSEDVMSWALYSDRFGFYSAKQAVKTNILYVPHAYDEKGITVEDYLRRSGCSFAREYVFDSFATVKRLAIRGLGIAVLPHRLAEEDVAAGKISKIQHQGFEKNGFGRHTIYATCAAHRTNDKRVRTLVSMLKAHFRV